MHKSLTFNGIRKPWLFLLQGRSKPPFSPVQRNTMTLPGMNGAYLESSKFQPLSINQPVGFVVDDDEHALQLKDELAEWLITEEPVALEFDDEPGRTYFAVVQNTMSDFEKFAELREGTIEFLCLDPYAYGPQHESALTGQGTIINVPGTAETKPVFELDVLAPITFAMVSDGERYNLIGTLSDDEVEVVDTKESVLYENGSTIDEWQDASMDMIDDPNVSNIGGELGSDGAGIRPNPYGPSGSGQRGGAAFKELPNLQDFELETTFDIISRDEIENWRMMIYLHDENMNNIGQLGLKDNSRNYKRRVPLGTAGPHSAGYNNGRVLGDRSEHNNDARDTTLFYLRMRREGQEFSFYVGEWYNFRHINVWEGTYNDVNNQYLGRLKYITLFIGSYQDRPIPSRIRMNSVEVFELSQATEDQAPYIARAGDTITFDHENEEILLNGEDATDLKDFGGEYFELPPGDVSIATLPDGDIEGRVRFRQRYK